MEMKGKVVRITSNTPNAELVLNLPLFLYKAFYAGQREKQTTAGKCYRQVRLLFLQGFTEATGKGGK